MNIVKNYEIFIASVSRIIYYCVAHVLFSIVLYLAHQFYIAHYVISWYKMKTEAYATVVGNYIVQHLTWYQAPINPSRSCLPTLPPLLCFFSHIASVHHSYSAWLKQASLTLPLNLFDKIGPNSVLSFLGVLSEWFDFFFLSGLRMSFWVRSILGPIFFHCRFVID